MQIVYYKLMKLSSVSIPLSSEFPHTIDIYSEHLDQASYSINQGSRTYAMVIQLLVRTEK